MANLRSSRFREIDFSNTIKKDEKISSIKDQIIELMRCYQFEFSSPENRKSMCHHISSYLEKEVIDKTTLEMAEKDIFVFNVKIGDKEYPLVTYLDYLEIIERRYKIQKIKSKLKYEKNNINFI